MHEITLCQRALELLIEQQASAYGAKRVTAVWIKNWRIFLAWKPALFPFVLIWYAAALAEGCKLHLS